MGEKSTRSAIFKVQKYNKDISATFHSQLRHKELLFCIVIHIVTLTMHKCWRRWVSY